METAWLAEVERLAAEVDRDPPIAIPAEQVFAEARRKLTDRP